MEFLVHITVNWPPDGDPVLRNQLIAAERARAAELADAGAIVRMWRIPGQWANWGIWSAADATELHELLSSLPFSRWLAIEVHPLADHPSDPQRAAPHNEETS